MERFENQSSYIFQNHSYFRRKDFFTVDNNDSLRPSFESISFAPEKENKTFLTSIVDSLAPLKKTHKKIYLLYSGGIDSEILFYAALKSGIPVTPVIVDLFGINKYELSYAKKILEKYNISNALWISVTENEWLDKWLPELVIDTESLSYMLSGAYIGARCCPTDSLILLSGENPSVLTVKNEKVYYVRHEYSMWTQKIEYKYNSTFFEPYNSPQVIKSYLSFPAVLQRLQSPVSFDEWTADFESLGKEYLYSDPELHSFERRFAQHGWEHYAGKTIYNKGMVRGLYKLFSSLENKRSTMLDQNYYINKLVRHLAKTDDVNTFITQQNIKSSDFNKHFYVRIGNLNNGEFTFCDQAEKTYTTHSGQII